MNTELCEPTQRFAVKPFATRFLLLNLWFFHALLIAQAPGDFNQDGNVDQQDLWMVLPNWRQSAATYPDFDLTRSEPFLNIADLTMWVNYNSEDPRDAPTFYVDQDHPNASDSHSGSSQDAPWQTLDHAFASVRPGDFVYVKGGVDRDDPASIYDRADRNGLDLQRPGTAAAPIVFQAYPGDTVILEGNFSEAGIALAEASHHRISGFIIRRFNQAAEGSNVKRDIIIEHCEFSDTRTTGLRLRDVSDMVVRDVLVHHCFESGISVRGGENVSFIRVASNDNFDGQGADGDADGFHTIGGDNIRFIDCEARRNGEDGFDLNANATLVNCVAEDHNAVNLKLWRREQDDYAPKQTTLVNCVFRNAGEAGVKISVGAQMMMYHCVVQGNGEEGIAFRESGLTPVFTSEIINSIISDNGGFGVDLRDGNDLYHSHNLYHQNGRNTVGFDPAPSAVVDQDPGFVAPARGDYRLTGGSPAVDAGTAVNPEAARYDFFGTARPVGQTVDIGYYERTDPPAGNRPAQFLTPAATQFSVQEGQTLQLDFNAEDADGDDFQFLTAGPLPAGATLDAETGALVFTPDFDQGGNTQNPSMRYTMSLLVVDAVLSEPFDRLDIEVTVDHVNRAPAYQGLDTYQLVVGRTAMMRLAVEDPDGDPVTFEIDGLPAGLQFDTELGTIMGTPEETGDAALTVTVTEATGTALQRVFPVQLAVKPTDPFDGWTALRVVPVRDNNELNAALAAAEPGDRLELATGVYPGPHRIDRSGTAEFPIVITAAPGAEVVFDGTGYSSPEAFNFNNNASHLALRGLVMRHEGESLYFRGNHQNITLVDLTIEDADYGLLGGTVDGLRVENVSLNRIADRGIDLGRVRNGLFHNVSVNGCGDRGINLPASGNDHLQMWQVTVRDCDRNGLIAGGRSVHLNGATIADTPVGLSTQSGTDLFLINSLTYDLDAGSNRAYGLVIAAEAFAVVEHVTVARSADFGVSFDSPRYLRFRNNLIAGNGVFDVRAEGGFGRLEAAYNLFDGAFSGYTPTPTSLIADPQFTSAHDGLMPAATSPAVGAAPPIDAVAFDITGRMRPRTGTVDLGAFQQ